MEVASGASIHLMGPDFGPENQYGRLCDNYVYNLRVGAEKMKLIGLIFVVVFVMGCSRDALTEADIFVERSPRVARQFVALHPTSIEAYRDAYREKQAIVGAMARGVKENLADTNAVQSYLDKMEAAYSTDARSFLTNFESRLLPGDTLYLYEADLADDDYTESGLLVLREGRIVYKAKDGGSQGRNWTGAIVEPQNLDLLQQPAQELSPAAARQPKP